MTTSTSTRNAIMCPRCGTPTSPWSCSCGETRDDPRQAASQSDQAAPTVVRPTRDAMNRRRRQWAYALVRKTAPGSPAYGTAEWLALPESSPEKIAAVVRAAECWARDGDELEERLRHEVELARHAFKVEEDCGYQQRAAAHKERWKHLRVIRNDTTYSQTEQFRAGSWPNRAPDGTPSDGGAA